MKIKMKSAALSLTMAGALALPAASAQSAVIYVEENGSTIELVGRIQPEVGTMFTRDVDSVYINGEENGMSTRVLSVLGTKIRQYFGDDGHSIIAKAEWWVNTERNDYQTDQEEAFSGNQEGWNVREAYAGIDFGQTYGVLTFGRKMMGKYKAMRTTDRMLAQGLRTNVYNTYATRYDDSYWWGRADGGIYYNYKNHGADIVIDYIPGNGKSTRLDHAFGITAAYKYKLDNGWSIKPIYAYSYFDGADSVAPRGYRYDGYSVPFGDSVGSLGDVNFNSFAHYDDYEQHILGVQIRNDNYYLGVSYVHQTHNLIPDNYRVSSDSFGGSNYGEGPSNINSSGTITAERCSEGSSTSTSLTTVWSCATARTFSGFEAIGMYKLPAMPKLTLKLRASQTSQDLEIERKDLNEAFDVTFNEAIAFEAEYRPERTVAMYASMRKESFYQSNELAESDTLNDFTWVTGIRYDY